MFFTAKKRCSRQKGVLPRAASGKNQFYRQSFVVDGKMLFCREQLLAKSFFFMVDEKMIFAVNSNQNLNQ
jgi:hypothetical protein